MATRRTTAPSRLVLAVVLALAAGLLTPATPAASAAGVPTVAAVPRQVSTASIGRPSRGYVIPSSSYFSYPNRSTLDRYAIRNRVLYTIQSVWGGARSSLGTPLPRNGTIRIATWSFNDWAVARALIAARNRGVSVQVMAAAGPNDDSAPWRYLRRHLGGYVYKPGHPETRETYSFARQCSGACRGRGGTPHAKYFLFDNVGLHHERSVVVSTSMNLTTFAARGQWNQAQVVQSSSVYHDFVTVFRQARIGRPVVNPYRVTSTGNVVDIFFPLPGATAAGDPVMQILNHVNCTGALHGGTSTGRTKIRIIQYAMYDDRGLWIARKLRYLWSRGCDVALIYSLMTRPVLSILRSHSGRGPIPMKQSIVRNAAGEIVKYNHSKWMTVTGHWGASRAAWLTFTGSANWSNLAFRSDEQMQRISSSGHALRYLATFSTTWRQGSSHAPSTTGGGVAGRVLANDPTVVAEDAPPFGQGIYKYMTED
jgi:hypothetical protein